jgi:two-component system phosphate regulon sensor histidine kinase PhoR
VSNWRALLLGARWLAVAAVLLTVVIWLALAYQYSVVSSAVTDGLTSQLRSEVDLVAGLLALDSDGTRLRTVSIPKERRLTLIASDGKVTFDSYADASQLDNHNTRPEVQQARREHYGFSRRHSDSIARELFYVAVALPDGRVLRIAAPIEVEEGLDQKLSQPMWIATALVITVSSIIILMHLWRDRTRVAELVAVARAFAKGEFTRRAGLLGSDVMAHLGHELNAMGERLQSSQNEIAGQKALLDAALGALSEGVACVDALDRVLYANPAYRQLAAGGAEVVMQPYYEHLPVLGAGPPGRAAGGAQDRESMASGSEIEHRRRQLRAMISPAGPGVRVVVLHDLTELKRLEGARRDFIAAVSHELKTPLTAIGGFTETLLDGALDHDPAIARDFIEKIARHSDRLAEIVRDVLTLSRLEQGAWEVRPSATDLVQMGRTIIDEYTRAAERQQVTLVLEAPERLPAVTDAELVRQLIGNLVSNAIRYNRPQGTVWLRMAATADNRISLVVQDTGIGIPSDHQERVFERFYRVDAHRSRQSGGTGLGLAIVKQLLDVLHGSISLQSDTNGTRFAVLLPQTDLRAELAVGSSLGTSHRL